MVNFSSRYARILSKIGALRAILVKSARYARSNLASGALRASQHSLTEVGVKWFFFPRGSVPVERSVTTYFARANARVRITRLRLVGSRGRRADAVGDGEWDGLGGAGVFAEGNRPL